MDRTLKGVRWVTTPTHSRDEGWTAIELRATRAEKTARVARAVFWDAEGQYAIETTDGEVPLVVMEQLIAEVRAVVGELP